MAEFKLRPSASPRWVNCPAAPRLEAQCPHGDDTAAREGDVLHVVGKQMIEQMCRGIEPTPSQYPQCNTDEYECAEVYARTVIQVARSAGAFAEPNLLLEKNLPCLAITGVKSGTPDAAVWAPHMLELHVLDLKSGFVPVKAEQNTQLLIYAIMLVQYLSIPLNDERIRVHLHIIQPRDWRRKAPDDVWTLTLAELADWCRWIDQRAQSAIAPDAPCSVGKWCVYCKARGRCKTFTQVSTRLAQFVMDDTTCSAEARTVQDIAVEADMLLAAKDVLDQRLAGVTMEAEALLKTGSRVPRYTINRKAGYENWSQNDETVASCLKQWGLEPYRVMTPNQVRKTGLIPERMLSALTKKRPGKAELVQLSAADVASSFENKG